MISNAPSDPPKWTWWPLQRRYLLSGLGFFGLIHLYFFRVNMSFAIVAMTKNQASTWYPLEGNPRCMDGQLILKRRSITQQPDLPKPFSTTFTIKLESLTLSLSLITDFFLDLYILMHSFLLKPCFLVGLISLYYATILNKIGRKQLHLPKFLCYLLSASV